MDCSPPGSSVPGISQARILEWAAISFSRGSSPPEIELGSAALQAESLPNELPANYICKDSFSKKGHLHSSKEQHKDMTSGGRHLSYCIRIDHSLFSSHQLMGICGFRFEEGINTPALNTHRSWHRPTLSFLLAAGREHHSSTW